MPELELKIRCQRCGEQMEMKEPAPGQPWRPDQFWVCPRCGRHFWSTYPNPPAASAPAPVASAPAASAPASAAPASAAAPAPAPPVAPTAPAPESPKS